MIRALCTKEENLTTDHTDDTDLQIQNGLIELF
jgi:hypothetical protein